MYLKHFYTWVVLAQFECVPYFFMKFFPKYDLQSYCQNIIGYMRFQSQKRRLLLMAKNTMKGFHLICMTNLSGTFFNNILNFFRTWMILLFFQRLNIILLNSTPNGGRG